MFSFVGEHKSAFVFSVGLHAAGVAALMLTFKLPSWQQQPQLAAPIQGVVVDASVLKAEQQRRDQVVRQEQQRKQREERDRREAVERQKQEKLAAEQQERDRVAEQKREADRKVQAEKERADAEKREQEKVAQEKRERDAREKREREEAEKKQREMRAQQQREKESAAELAAEAEQAAAIRSGKLDKYALDITLKIERNWSKPLSAPPDLECELRVTQTLTGLVIDAQLGQCNGDAAVKESIVRAVMKASPLPMPDPPLKVERNLNVTFRPSL
jgi:colicin import membrane protein